MKGFTIKMCPKLVDHINSRMKEKVYIFQNLEAQRVKVGMTINQPADRLKSINDMWAQFSATCQVCGGRRLMDLGCGLMPAHSSSGPHLISGFNCAGSLKPPLESDVSIAESYLADLRQRHGKSSGTEKGSLTRMIRNLEKRIELYRSLELPVGKWRVGVVFYTDHAEVVESLAHQTLIEYLDKQAPFGEVFYCSLQEAEKAVEQALSDLGLQDSASKETQALVKLAEDEAFLEYQNPAGKPVRFECVMCKIQWEGIGPGAYSCPKCESHLYSKLIEFL